MYLPPTRCLYLAQLQPMRWCWRPGLWRQAHLYLHELVSSMACDVEKDVAVLV
jgi:hypothetical protein